MKDESLKGSHGHPAQPPVLPGADTEVTGGAQQSWEDAPPTGSSAGEPECVPVGVGQGRPHREAVRLKQEDQVLLEAP